MRTYVRVSNYSEDSQAASGFDSTNGTRFDIDDFTEGCGVRFSKNRCRKIPFTNT